MNILKQMKTIANVATAVATDTANKVNLYAELESVKEERDRAFKALGMAAYYGKTEDVVSITSKITALTDKKTEIEEKLAIPNSEPIREETTSSEVDEQESEVVDPKEPSIPEDLI